MAMRWYWLVLSVIFILLAFAGGYIYAVAHGGLPKTSGTVKADVGASVEIYRDEFGTPHIIAASTEDLFFAHGYVQAQDRLWQMDMNRRGVGGKLSEILGEEFVDTDLFTLTVGFYRAAEKNYHLLEAGELSMLEAYADGVNAYIEKNRGALPPEFALLGYSPEPWQPLDSLAIAVYMSWYLGGNMDSELFHLALLEQVGAELALEIFPHYPEYGPIIAQSEADGNATSVPLDDNNVDALVKLSRLAELNGKARFVQGMGSNNWVISGDLTPGEGALLANDMHLGMSQPSIWHAAHLVIEDELNITGVMFPGIPGIIAGFNEYLAWGLTNVGPDVQDLYRLVINPDNPQQYLYMDEWVDAEIVVEEFMVDGEAEPREVEVMITRFGPVISDVVEDLDIPLSLRWTALEGTREFKAVMGLMESRNWEEFTSALEYFMSPAQNFVYADREGNIGYRANGLIPIRRAGDGLLPADGTTDEYEWEGYIPWDELPTLYNPPEGIIVTANHRIVDDDYPYHITEEWAPPYRAMSIRRYLENKNSFTLEDMIPPQSSFYNSQAEILGPVLIEALQNAELEETAETALEVFKEWLEEPVEDAEAAGAAVYNVLYFNLIEQTFADEMGEDLFERFLHTRANINAFDRMLIEGESAWFNNINTESVEARDDIIRLAFEIAVDFLVENLGSDPGRWQWGDLHTITFKHDMGSIPLLGRLYNRGPFPVGGSFNTPANMTYQLTDPYEVTHSAPCRYMVDLSDHRALDVLAIGSSGHMLSDHYDDQLEMWLEGGYKEMIFRPEAVRNLPEKLLLEPQ